MKRIALVSLMIVFVYLSITSWQCTAQEKECVSGVEPERDENGFYCPSGYPIYCAVCFVISPTIPSQFCCPEGYSCDWSEALNCCKCPSETIYKDNEEALTLLRKFRDNILSQSPIGQEIIKLYYNMSPAIVRAMEEDEEFKQEVKEMIDEIMLMIRGTVE